MQFSKSGHLIVRTDADIITAEARNYMYVYAICPNCGDGWTSLIPNAKNIIKKGCLGCVGDYKEKWIPKIGVIKK